MSIHFGELRDRVRDIASTNGVSEGAAAMMLMTMGVMAMAREIPAPFRGALTEASARWFAGVTDRGSLVPARVACWKFLQKKHGTNTTVEDREDIAVRGLICVLWDEPNEGDDVVLGLGFFADMVDRFGGLEGALGLSG